MKKIRKIKKTITKDNLFTKDEISLDNKENQQYFDNLVYQQYLKKLKSEGGGLHGE